MSKTKILQCFKGKRRQAIKNVWNKENLDATVDIIKDLVQDDNSELNEKAEKLFGEIETGIHCPYNLNLWQDSCIMALIRGLNLRALEILRGNK